MADALTLRVRMSDALSLRVRKADGVACVVRSDLSADMRRPGAEYLASLHPERPERLLRPDAAPASGPRIFFLMMPFLDRQLWVYFAPTFPSGLFITYQVFASSSHTTLGVTDPDVAGICCSCSYLFPCCALGCNTTPPFSKLRPVAFPPLDFVACTVLLCWNAVLQPLHPSGRLSQRKASCRKNLRDQFG